MSGAGLTGSLSKVCMKLVSSDGVGMGFISYDTLHVGVILILNVIKAEKS